MIVNHIIGSYLLIIGGNCLTAEMFLFVCVLKLLLKNKSKTAQLFMALIQHITVTTMANPLYIHKNTTELTLILYHLRKRNEI